MGLPLGSDFDVSLNKPIDSRFTWSGTVSNLNQIAVNGANRYLGLITYISSDKNLYVYQGNDTWEKIVTNNVDSRLVTFTNAGGSFDIRSSDHGQVIYVSSPVPVTGTWTGSGINYPEGFNVSIVQESSGNVMINNAFDISGVNRLNLRATAGRYSVATILRIRDTNNFLIYGDLV